MTTNTDPTWSPSEAREAIRTDLARLRQDVFAPAGEEWLLVQALRGDEPALARFEAFKGLARKLVVARALRGAS